ncbi:ferredoxin--NADP reductase [Nocardioides sp. AE5]|uniref:ferredoxin--NADP reductase n=1 Tax=Nocardioides sp. AE5 TaxID=2962573 RepID=UPI00288104C2|nr:ferredoxin--NADP reductase [Nocardioides sp. AE5]MDT0201658.1 ferredoxin--NADP reductase [Nocardioides sp. AE5]
MASLPQTDSLAPDVDLLGHVLTVDRVVAETDDAVTIWFHVPDHLAEEYAFRAGQFLTLAVPSERTGWVARCYSISSSPTQPDIAVTVKRTRDGYASNWLCDNVAAGSRLRVLPPSGLFCPRLPEADLLLCAAGSGVTPAMSILRTVLASVTGRIAFFYANRDADSIIFRDELEALAAEHGERLVVEHWLESERGIPTADDFAAWASPYSEREIFTCGPAPFMEMVRVGAETAGFDTFRIQTEEYRSLTGDPFQPIAEISAENLSDAALAEVNIDGEVHSLAWPATHTLVDVMVLNGIDTPYACREGKCGACTCHLGEGTVDLGRTDALEAEDIADGYILACQAKPSSKSIKVEF